MGGALLGRARGGGSRPSPLSRHWVDHPPGHRSLPLSQIPPRDSRGVRSDWEVEQELPPSHPRLLRPARSRGCVRPRKGSGTGTPPLEPGSWTSHPRWPLSRGRGPPEVWGSPGSETDGRLLGSGSWVPTPAPPPGRSVTKAAGPQGNPRSAEGAWALGSPRAAPLQRQGKWARSWGGGGGRERRAGGLEKVRGRQSGRGGGPGPGEPRGVWWRG